jgi:hypothetical protein
MGNLIQDHSGYKIMTFTDNENPGADVMLARLEQQLDRLDIKELLRGSTITELEEKGFIGDRQIAITRAAPRLGTEKEHLLFEPEVEYDRMPEGTAFDELTIDKLHFLKDVEEQSLIATREENERIPFKSGENVRLEKDGLRERYFAQKRGKVVIIGERLHIFPSDIDCRIAIKIAPDGMTASADCSPGNGRGKPLTIDRIKMALFEAGVTCGIIDETLAAIVEKANGSLLKQCDIEVAKGNPPRTGRAGEVHYAFDSSPREYDFKILPDGRIDYKNARNIIMAAAGDLLATIADPAPGIPGTDVLGRPVPAESGKSVALMAGSGVRMSEDGRSFFAEINGSVMLNGSVLEVVDTYIVNGDVDYSTGNIEFSGNVFISGNIAEGFTVHASGDIVVMKNVESSRVEAGRDVIVKGGVQGKGKGLVGAGRDIKIGFAQNARMEAQGNISIGNSAVNCYLFSSKQLIMTSGRGAIIGGEVYAQRGVEVRSVGSESGVKTFVEAGTDFLVLKKIVEIDQEIEFTQSNLRKIEDSLKIVVATIKKNSRFSCRTTLVKKALEKRSDLEKRLCIMTAKRADLWAQSRDQDACFIKVSGRCFADVQIKIRDARLVVDAARDSVCFYEDRKDKQIKAGPF